MFNVSETLLDFLEALGQVASLSLDAKWLLHPDLDVVADRGARVWRELLVELTAERFLEVHDKVEQQVLVDVVNEPIAENEPVGMDTVLDLLDLPQAGALLVVHLDVFQ